MLRVYFGNHKCASRYITFLLERICNEMSWKYFCAYHFEIEKHGSLQALIDTVNPDFLMIPETSDKTVEMIKIDFLGFHLTRDPRDVIVSCYFSHKNSHKIGKIIPTAEHRQKLNELSLEEGIDHEISISKVFIKNLYDWQYNYANIYETTFEKITAPNNVEFLTILRSLDMIEENKNPLFPIICLYNRVFKKLNLSFLTIKLKKYSKKMTNKTLSEISFKSLSRGRRIGVSDENSHYRKGISGDWKNYLTADQVNKIQDLYPNLMQKLNYHVEP